MVLILAGIGAGGVYVWKGSSTKKSNDLAHLVTETVKRAPLEISITERGSLESANNVTLTCLVEGEAGTGIIKIVDEGTRVVKDQVLVELDSSRLRNDSSTQQIAVEQAEAAMKQAEKNVEIQKTQNESDIAAAELKLELAKLDAEKYKEGDYKQEVRVIEGEVRLAKEELLRAKEKYEFTQRLIKKGYATQQELEADRIAVAKAEVAVNTAGGKREVLDKYTSQRQIAETEANAKEYGRELERVKLKSQAALAQYEADFSAKKLTFKVEKDKYEKLIRQIEFCIIKAPRDGLVVYANTRSGFRGGSEPLIYEGAKVKERQAIINLPDVANMQVNARVHESKIDMVREGLPATVRVDARPGENFHGIVETVSLVPMSGNWPNINLKEYTTFIKITDESSKVTSLKPGLTAEVEILIDRLNAVLQAPLQAFVERGGRHFVWIIDENGKAVRREVKTGKSSERMQEVVEDEALYAKNQGLKEGDRVILTPRTVLPKEVALLEEEIAPVVEAPPVQGKLPEGPAKGAPGAPAGSPGNGPSAGGGGPLAGGPGGAPGGERGAGRGGPGGRGGMPSPTEMFARLDKNSDGKVTEDEIEGPMKQLFNFAQNDLNKDKSIDKDEWEKAAAAFQARGPGAGRGGPPGAGGPGAGGGQ